MPTAFGEEGSTLVLWPGLGKAYQRQRLQSPQSRGPFAAFRIVEAHRRRLTKNPYWAVYGSPSAPETFGRSCWSFRLGSAKESRDRERPLALRAGGPLPQGSGRSLGHDPKDVEWVDWTVGSATPPAPIYPVWWRSPTPALNLLPRIPPAPGRLGRVADPLRASD